MRAFCAPWLAAALALAGCGPAEPERPGGTAPASAPGSEPAGERPFERTIRIHAPVERSRVVLKPGPDSVRIALNEAGTKLVVTGYLWGNHRRYEGEGRLPLAKARTAGASILVTSPQDADLWRVTARGGTVRIGQGRNDPEPYVLARRGPSRLLVRRGSKELGRVVAARGLVKVRDAGGRTLFVARDDRVRALYGVLLLSEIPPAERAVLLAELAQAGR